MGTADRYQFGDWLVDVPLNRLSRNGTESTIERKTMDVLVCLLSRPGEVVSNEDLLESVWHGRIVEDGAVHQRISHLRRALGDNSRAPEYIASVPRRGYRTVARVTIPNAGESASRTAGWLVLGVFGLIGVLIVAPLILSSGPVKEPAVDDRGPAVARFAVLALRDVSRNQQLDAIAIALSQEIRHELTRYERGIWPDWTIDVVPERRDGESSPPRLADFADYVLDGTVNRYGETIELKAELIDTAADDQLWAQTFRAEDVGLVAAQAARHAAWFAHAVSGNGWGPRRIAWGTFSEYLRYHMGDNLDLSRFWLQRTLELDPGWRAGWEELAWSWLYLGELLRDPSYFPRAREANQQGLGWESFMRIELQAYVEGDLNGAEVEAREHALNRGAYGYAWLMLHSGLYREGEAYFQWFNAQMPHHAGGWRALAMTHALQGDAVGAVESSQRLAAIMPATAVSTQYGLAWGLTRLGRIAEAKTFRQSVFENTARLAPASPTALNQRKFLHILDFEIAMAENDLPAAQTAAQSLAMMGFSASAGVRFLQLGDPRAQHLLEQSARDAAFVRREWLWLVAFTPRELREHPSFLKLQDDLGYTLDWKKELCRRAHTLGEPHIDCDPGQFENVAMNVPSH